LIGVDGFLCFLHEAGKKWFGYRRNLCRFKIRESDAGSLLEVLRNLRRKEYGLLVSFGPHQVQIHIGKSYSGRDVVILGYRLPNWVVVNSTDAPVLTRGWFEDSEISLACDLWTRQPLLLRFEPFLEEKTEFDTAMEHITREGWRLVNEQAASLGLCVREHCTLDVEDQAGSVCEARCQ